MRRWGRTVRGLHQRRVVYPPRKTAQPPCPLAERNPIALDKTFRPRLKWGSFRPLYGVWDDPGGSQGVRTEKYRHRHQPGLLRDRI